MSETRAEYQPNGLLTTEDVAELTGLSVRSVLYHIRADHLPARKMRTYGDGKRGGYYRWLIRPEDAETFKARLERGEIGQRGGNYGGGRPVTGAGQVGEDFTHLYLPCDSDHRRWLAERLLPAERLAVLNRAAHLKLRNPEKFQRMLEE